ncbi:hypothetical protein [Streptomyces erythrochromogenes]|uniref:hypothetical protein n=1 Tax=Streptomyces erythrochromogenes TaxID=285574 RepID=UPI00225B0E98|nr:hypothetical protein [Streptomyces erythrochromogenes]MCX5584251.1 hypothetical protein [Streptomyces erythrochromogenes]
MNDTYCELCFRPAATRVHDGCKQKIRENLLDLPSLYAALADALQPVRRGDSGRASSGRTAPIPCNLEALDLRARGGIEGVVATWAADLCEREQWQLPQYGSIEAAVDGYTDLLIRNLDMICDEHPAVREFAAEIRQIVGQASRLTTGEKPPRRIPVQCGCGTVLRITIDTPGARCPGCETQYGHAEVLQLPMAERAAA